MTPEIEAELLSCARLAAVAKQDHDYLPKTAEEAETFQPHGWVLAAMRLAFGQGEISGVARATEIITKGLS